MANYINSSDVEQYLGVTLTDNGLATFNLIQQPMQDLVDLYTNRSWNFTNPITEMFDMYQNSNPPMLVDTFFPKYTVDTTPYSASYPQAGGIRSITVGKVNGQGGTPLDLTYVYNYRTHIKFWTWYMTMTMFNPFGFKNVEIVYNSDAAGALPKPVKLALIQWVARMVQEAPDAGKGTTEVMAGTIRAKFNPTMPQDIPDFVKFVLDKYRTPSLDHF